MIDRYKNINRVHINRDLRMLSGKILTVEINDSWVHINSVISFNRLNTLAPAPSIAVI